MYVLCYLCRTIALVATVICWLYPTLNKFYLILSFILGYFSWHGICKDKKTSTFNYKFGMVAASMFPCCRCSSSETRYVDIIIGRSRYILAVSIKTAPWCFGFRILNSRVRTFISLDLHLVWYNSLLVSQIDYLYFRLSGKSSYGPTQKWWYNHTKNKPCVYVSEILYSGFYIITMTSQWTR